MSPTSVDEAVEPAAPSTQPPGGDRREVQRVVAGQAIATSAQGYANQTEPDYRAFLEAIKLGRIVATTAR